MPADQDMQEKPINPPAIPDADTIAFRQASESQVLNALEISRLQLQEAFEGTNPDTIAKTVLTASDAINRAVMRKDETDVLSVPNTTHFVEALGAISWIAPQDWQSQEAALMAQLAQDLANGTISQKRFSEGVYMMGILIHKYENGNGRTVRGLKFLLDSIQSREEITTERVKSILGTKPHETKKNTHCLSQTFYEQ